MRQIQSILITSLLWLLSLIPLFLWYGFARFVYVIIFKIWKYRTKVVHENIFKSFPELNETHVNEIVKKYYTHLSELLVEAIKMISISKATLQKRVILQNITLLDKLFAEGKDIIIVVAHGSNWEWGGLALSASTPYSVLGVYKPLNNVFMDGYFKKIRSRFGLVAVPMRQIYKTMLLPHTKPTATVLIADQSPVKHEAQIWLPFMGRTVPIFSGLEKLAQKTNRTVLYAEMQKTKRGFYTLRFDILAESPNTLPENELTQRYITAVENSIKKQPEYYLWSHRRWKHEKLTDNSNQ